MCFVHFNAVLIIQCIDSQFIPIPRYSKFLGTRFSNIGKGQFNVRGLCVHLEVFTYLLLYPKFGLRGEIKSLTVRGRSLTFFERALCIGQPEHCSFHETREINLLVPQVFL